MESVDQQLKSSGHFELIRCHYNDLIPLGPVVRAQLESMACLKAPCCEMRKLRIDVFRFPGGIYFCAIKLWNSGVSGDNFLIKPCMVLFYFIKTKRIHFDKCLKEQQTHTWAHIILYIYHTQHYYDTFQCFISVWGIRLAAYPLAKYTKNNANTNSVRVLT